MRQRSVGAHLRLRERVGLWLRRLGATIAGQRKAAGRPPQPARPAGRPSYARSSSGTRFAVPREDTNSFHLYSEMRTHFPVLDVAITKLVRLAGTVQVQADEATREELSEWMRGVRVNAAGQGFDLWLSIAMDEMMQYGRSVSELVPNRSRTDVFGVLNLEPKSIEFRTVPDQPLTLEVLQWQGRGAVTIPEAVALVALHNPQSDSPHGVSLYRSLPTVAEALSVIENATVQVWRRMGAPPYHVNLKLPAGFQDPDGTLAEQALDTIETHWQAAMDAREQGKVHDFHTVGDVSVEVIGNKNAIFEVQAPFRAFAEQVVAATGLPSWMFGFSWSNTETLSVQQADVIVANVQAIRRGVMPAIERLIETRQRLRGKPSVKLTWGQVNLRDLTEQARGRAWQEQGQARRIENAVRMWQCGFWTQLEAAKYADPTLKQVARTLAEAPASDAQQPVGLHPASDE